MQNFFAQFFPNQFNMQGELIMGTINKVILIGRLGRDPEERVTSAGSRVANFTMATDTFHSNGADKTTEWHKVVAFGKIAELCNQYLHKGNLVCIEGSLQTRTWEKPPGEKHYMTEVIANRITFLGSKQDSPHHEDGAMPF
jgi:single-strand DNA-binding protein